MKRILPRYLLFSSASLLPRFSRSSISSYSIGNCSQLKGIPLLNNLFWIVSFSYSNSPMALSLLLRRECCTFSNGEYVKSGLAMLEKWIADVTEEVSIIFFLLTLHSYRNLLSTVVCRNLLA